eukprot:6207380-Pleurochrysis_carterae.AAC.2
MASSNREHRVLAVKLNQGQHHNWFRRKRKATDGGRVQATLQSHLAVVSVYEKTIAGAASSSKSVDTTPGSTCDAKEVHLSTSVTKPPSVNLTSHAYPRKVAGSDINVNANHAQVQPLGVRSVQNAIHHIAWTFAVQKVAERICCIDNWEQPSFSSKELNLIELYADIWSICFEKSELKGGAHRWPCIGHDSSTLAGLKRSPLSAKTDVKRASCQSIFQFFVLFGASPSREPEARASVPPCYTVRWQDSFMSTHNKKDRADSNGPNCQSLITTNCVLTVVRRDSFAG